MITRVIKEQLDQGAFDDKTVDPRNMILCEFRCESTDTKPTDCANGSELFEIDTGKVYVFNADTATWVEV